MSKSEEAKKAAAAKKAADKAAKEAAEDEKKTNPLLSDEGDDDSDSEDEEDSEDVEDIEDNEDSDDGDEEPADSKKKPAPIQAKPPVNIERQHLSDIQATKKTLEAEEQVMFMIPLVEGEKSGAAHECFINGYKVVVPKGVMTKVPRSVAEILSQHYKVAYEAGQSYRLDMSTDKQNALG